MFNRNDNIILYKPYRGRNSLFSIQLFLYCRGYRAQIEERKISIDELLEAHANGSLREVFGTGTAATISMIKELKYKSFEIHFDTDTWQVATELKKRLNAIRDGIVADTHGWLFPVNIK